MEQAGQPDAGNGKVTHRPVDMRSWDEDVVLAAGNAVSHEVRGEGDARYGRVKVNDTDAASPQEKGRTPDDPQAFQRGLFVNFAVTGSQGS